MHSANGKSADREVDSARSSDDDSERARPGKTVHELAEIVGGKLVGGDPTKLIRRVMPTDTAIEDAVTFVTKPRYLALLPSTRAGAVMLSADMLDRQAPVVPEGTAIIRVASPYVAFARAAQALASRIPGPIGVHPAAAIDPAAKIGRGVAVGPFVYVGPRADVGDGVVLYPGVHIEAEATVGPGSVLYNHVVVRHRCRVGARCIIHPGVVIGSDGFGFAQPESEGSSFAERNVKIPQVGDVVIEDDVEIGSNTCIDRATLGTTRIGAGTKIDNLVQIGHNVEVGPGCILVAQSGVAGSARLGRGVTIAAQAGVSGHIEIGDRVTLYGQAGLAHDVPPDQKLMGSPAQPQTEFLRNAIRVRKLDALFSRVRKLERLMGGTGDE